MPLNKTPYYEDLRDYYERAKTLNLRNIGQLPPGTVSGDPLQDQVTIYDTAWRRYAGFSKVLEQLWYGPESWTKRKSQISYGQDVMDMSQWLYVCLVHRLTGSGASFEADHGYRNTAVIEMVEERGPNIFSMAEFLKHYDKPMFTSIGNQIPPFNKSSPGWDKGGREFLCVHAPKLAIDTAQYLENNPRYHTIQEMVDQVLFWMVANGFKKYKFVLTAWVMDMAEYYPEFVDPDSDVHLGANAIKTAELIYDKPKRSEHEEAMRIVCDDFGAKPYDMEDVWCDFIRYVNNYVPKNYTIHPKRLPLRSELS